MRHEPDPHKESMSPSTQNFKAMSLWYSFLDVAELFHFYSICDLDSHLDT